jgi:hypothetical protein
MVPDNRSPFFFENKFLLKNSHLFSNNFVIKMSRSIKKNCGKVLRLGGHINMSLSSKII